MTLSFCWVALVKMVFRHEHFNKALESWGLFVKRFSLPWFCSKMSWLGQPTTRVCVCMWVCVSVHTHRWMPSETWSQRGPWCPVSPTQHPATLQLLQAPCSVLPLCGLPEHQPCHVCPVGFAYHHWLLDSFCGWLGFPFLFIHCLVMCSFKFCLNFVCLSFSPAYLCLSTLFCWLFLVFAHSCCL